MKKIPAYSPTTGKSYDSWDDLVAAEAHGYTVIIVMRQWSGDTEKRVYTRSVGLYPTKKEANQKAAQARIRWYKALASDPLNKRDVVSVNTEPVWKELDPMESDV